MTREQVSRLKSDHFLELAGKVDRAVRSHADLLAKLAQRGIGRRLVGVRGRLPGSRQPGAYHSFTSTSRPSGVSATACAP